MRKTVLAAVAASAALVMSCVVVACSSSDGASSGGSGDPNEAGSSGNDGASSSGDDGGGGSDGSFDATRQDGDTTLDGALPDEGGSMDPPSVRMVGRFAPDGTNAYFAFPGSKLIARFNGTDATVTFSQTDGFSVGHSWFNLTVDGVAQAPFEVNGTSIAYDVAKNLPAGIHTVELEKRTEANLGVVHYEGFTFGNGGTLLSPPARPTRRIEVLSDSTVDGFGVEGSRIAGSANDCMGGDPANYNNAAKGTGEVAAASLNAESFLIAYSGKGLTVNESAGDNLYFPALYTRTLPDQAGSTWSSASWTPDAVVLSIGGTDFDGKTSTPAGFDAAYGGLVDTIRANYPQAWIFLTVWSQIKDDTIPTRTAMKNALNAIVAERPGDTKLDVFTFPEANVDVDETGCEYHGNATHEANMAALLVTEMKSKIGW